LGCSYWFGFCRLWINYLNLIVFGIFLVFYSFGFLWMLEEMKIQFFFLNKVEFLIFNNFLDFFGLVLMKVWIWWWRWWREWGKKMKKIDFCFVWWWCTIRLVDLHDHGGLNLLVKFIYICYICFLSLWLIICFLNIDHATIYIYVASTLIMPISKHERFSNICLRYLFFF